MNAPVARQTRSMIAARKNLLGRRAAMARLAAGGERDRQELSAVRGEQLAENEEITSVIEQLTAREREELGEIDAALERMAQGAWGTCEACGEAIARPRLAAVPEARRCVTCAR